MKNNINNPFMPCSGSVSRPDSLKQLISMRTETVNTYGFFAPDSLYPVYTCKECGAMEVSLSVLKPDTEDLQSFESYVRYLASLAGSLPLAPCKGCKSSNPSSPAWIGFFTYLSEAACDLFLHIEDGKVTNALKIHMLGDPEPVDKLENDEDFLAAFGFPFSYRWAWQKLIDSLAGKDVFQVQKIHDGYYLAIDGAGKTPDQKWQGWFAETSAKDNLDSALVISSQTLDSTLDQGPADWLEPEDIELIEEDRLRLFVFYSSEKYIQSLRSTLLQRGITLNNDNDSFSISIDDYFCEIPVLSLLRAAAMTGSPNLQMLRRHLMSRIELLEAIRGTGRRLSNLFEENYLVSITDGCTLEVREPEDSSLIRSIPLLECSEISTLAKDDFETLVSEQLGYDLSKDLFSKGN